MQKKYIEYRNNIFPVISGIRHILRKIKIKKKTAS